MTDLSYLPARRLADRIKRRELTATEALQTYLDRIAKHNPALNAVVSLNADRAFDAARAADATAAPTGALHGVPMTLKDAHDVAGLRTTIGTEVFDRMPSTDGTVAARLRAAGAIIVGHSNVPPFLADYRSENPIFGRTTNPWDAERTPGGSSGGATAALAAGLTPVEVGSDLAGSLRLPPHFCGVYGLKATENRIPTTGFFRPPDGLPPSVRILGSLGPLARDLADLELVLRIISGPTRPTRTCPRCRCLADATGHCPSYGSRWRRPCRAPPWPRACGARWSAWPRPPPTRVRRSNRGCPTWTGASRRSSAR